MGLDGLPAQRIEIWPSTTILGALRFSEAVRCNVHPALPINVQDQLGRQRSDSASQADIRTGRLLVGSYIPYHR